MQPMSAAASPTAPATRMPFPIERSVPSSQPPRPTPTPLIDQIKLPDLKTLPRNAAPRNRAALKPKFELTIDAKLNWSPRAESNRRPRSYQERALPLSYLGARAGRRRQSGTPARRAVGECDGMVEGAGFEPAKPVRAPDLQSGGFNHSPTPPCWWYEPRTGSLRCRAPEGTRTPSLSITSRLR